MKGKNNMVIRKTRTNKNVYLKGLVMMAFLSFAFTQDCMAASAADTFVKFIKDVRGILKTIGLAGGGTGLIVFIVMALSGRVNWKLAAICIGVVLALLGIAELLSLVGTD